MLKKLISWGPILVYLVGFIEIALLVLMVFSSISYDISEGWNPGYYAVINSDSTLLYQVSGDFLEYAASLLDWDFGTCFYFFPNLLIVLLTRIFSGNPSVSLFISALVFFSLHIFLINILFRKVFPGISKYGLAISGLVVSLFLVYTIISRDFVHLSSHLFLPLHAGAFLNTLLALILVFSYLNRGNPWRYMTALAVLNIAAIFSDMIYLVYFLAPALISLLTLYLFRRNFRSQIIWPIAVTVFSGLAGYLLHRYITHHEILHLYPLKREPGNIGSSLQLMLATLKEFSTKHILLRILAGLTVLSFLVTIAMATFKLVKVKKNEVGNSMNILLYMIFTGYFFIASFAAPVVNGTFLGIDCLRYILPAVFLVLFNLGILLEYFTRGRWKKISIPALLAGAIILYYGIFIGLNIAEKNPLSSFKKVHDFYPPIARAADELSREYDAKYGLSDYWNSRLITLFSKENVRINQAGSTFNPVKWANNPYHYYYDDYKDKEQVVYNFVVLRNLEDTTGVYKMFDKEEIERITIDGYDFFLVPDFILNEEFTAFEPWTGER